MRSTARANRCSDPRRPRPVGASQVPALVAGHKVIVADSRGHGRSTRSEQPLGYALMADDYLALLDHLGSTSGAGRLERRRHHRARHRDPPSRAAEPPVRVRRQLRARGVKAASLPIRPSTPTSSAPARTVPGCRRRQPVRCLRRADLENVGDRTPLYQGPAARDQCRPRSSTATTTRRSRPRTRPDRRAGPGRQARDHEGRQPLRDVAAVRGGHQAVLDFLAGKDPAQPPAPVGLRPNASASSS